MLSQNFEECTVLSPLGDEPLGYASLREAVQLGSFSASDIAQLPRQPSSRGTRHQSPVTVFPELLDCCFRGKEMVPNL